MLVDSTFYDLMTCYDVISVSYVQNNQRNFSFVDKPFCLCGDVVQL